MNCSVFKGKNRKRFGTRESTVVVMIELNVLDFTKETHHIPFIPFLQVFKQTVGIFELKLKLLQMSRAVWWDLLWVTWKESLKHNGTHC